VPRKKKRRELTAKQRAMIKALAKTRHIGKAALKAGYSPKNPDQSGHQALQAIQKAAPELLAKHGLDDDSLIEKHLLPLMNAKETKFFSIPVGRGKTRTLQIHHRDTISWNARKEGLDMAFKIRGMYVREAENKGPEFTVIIINAENRPDWAKMRAAQKTIDVPGLTGGNGSGGNGNS
jgi:hypothetical protein